MADDGLQEAIKARVLIRLDTLMRLRWYAVIGQAGAVLVVAFGFGFEMLWAPCLLLVALSAALNLWLNQSNQSNHRVAASGIFRLLMFDLVQLGVLLFLTGGLQNPFAILLVAPVVVSSTSLTRDHTLILGGTAIAIITALAFFHLPLPWQAEQALEMPFLFIAGVWVSIICTLAFTAIYAYRVAQEARRLANALAATEMVLQREQHLTALDGLAAAAAHELGTPLATIALVSKEMIHALPKDSDLLEDAKLLRSQAQRCRDILQKLASLSSEGEPIIQQQRVLALVEEVVAPLRDLGAEIEVMHKGDPKVEPTLQRSPGVNYGLGNLIDNAVNFARQKVIVGIEWEYGMLSISVSDDGPGFPPSLQRKIGDPFVTARKAAQGARPRGLGLGLFIAKTLLERSGAELTFGNGTAPSAGQTGAHVQVVWDQRSLD